MIPKEFAPIANAILRVKDGGIPFPLREKRSRYTHLTSTPKAKTIVIHRPKYIITADEKGDVKVIKDRSIYIKNGVITEIFDPKKRKIDLNKVDLVFDAGLRGGLAVTPGFINAHSHPPMYMLRSSLMLEKGENLEKSLKDMFNLESNMTDEDFFISAVGDLTEEQKNGITTTLSHYAVFDAIEEASKLVNQNVINAISAVSNSHPENTPAYVEKLLKNKKNYSTQVAVAVHTLHKADPAILKKVAAICKKYKAIFTTHAAETRDSVAENLRVHDDLTIPTLQKYGLANSRSILSHCVNLTEEEVAMIKKYNIGVVHLPTSNKLHKSGEFQYPLFAKYGAEGQIALGTDSVISKNSLDILSEALQARIMHQDKYVVYYEELFKMMTYNAAQILGLKTRGRILPGFQADLAFWKVRDRGFIPYAEDKPVTIIGNMITHGGRNVRDLMINGEFIISNRRHDIIDETELLNQIQAHHQAMRKRLKKVKQSTKKKSTKK
ncbi:MAG: amidohydrolase family protein [Candidatus Kerfeldbacteria bacterium]